MPYLLMASLARLLLEGGVWQNGSAPGNVLERQPGVAKPVLIEPHHADPMIAALYADIRDTLGLPFVNTDYRAFARWPSYFSAAWPDLKAAIQTSSYVDLTRICAAPGARLSHFPFEGDRAFPAQC
ncbi:hypothetical protein G5B39_16210 (plasmid) [Rhodobacteraceae bacterium SC52]|nr:hypothetical protein G5B39_16210 [Rhodobacteraceae bacterium SC52]